MRMSWLSALGVIALLPACEDRGTAPNGMVEREPVTPRVGARPVRGIRPGSDDDRLAIEKQIPGFAGFYYDLDGNMRVVLTDTSRIGQARALLLPRLQARPVGFGRMPGRTVPAGEPIVIPVQGQYSYSELHRWKIVALQAGLGRGVTGAGVDVESNQVLIGIDKATDASAVTTLLTGLGIPAAALKLGKASAARPRRDSGDGRQPNVRCS